MKGKLIAFEGIDGSGKTTQIELLKKRLTDNNVLCYTTKEPTDSSIGSLIHQIMIGSIEMDNKAIAALFVADRLDHLLNKTDGIYEKTQKGITVLTDRYYFSSYAYHSVDMPMDWVIKANEQSTLLLRPALNIFIDVDPEISMKRITRNRDHVELFETKSRLIEVRKRYMEAFQKLENEENYVIIDGNQSVEKIAEDVWKCVSEL